MNRHSQKIIERLRGTGDVVRANEVVTKVRYSLEVIQDVVEVRSFGDSSLLDGQEDVRGTVSVVSGGFPFLNPNDEPFTLRLEDGRWVDFWPKSYGPYGSFAITATGGLQGEIADGSQSNDGNGNC